jgi:hypothetical protein
LKNLSDLIARNVPILMTDGLAQRLQRSVPLDSAHVHVLPVKQDPKSLLELPQADLDAIRQPLLEPLGREFKAPNRVGLYLFSDGSWVIENFGDRAASVQLDDVVVEIPARGWRYNWIPQAGGSERR